MIRSSRPSRDSARSPSDTNQFSHLHQRMCKAPSSIRLFTQLYPAATTLPTTASTFTVTVISET